jgi:hypothetical protein
MKKAEISKVIKDEVMPDTEVTEIKDDTKSNFKFFLVSFEANREKNWEVEANCVNLPWFITHVYPSGQFYKKGVEVGWIVLEINDVKITEKNKQQMMKIVENGNACAILFDIFVKSKITDLKDDNAEPTQ